MYGLDRKRYFWVALSALVQGLLLGYYSASQGGPILALPLSVVIAVPFTFWLAQEHWGRRLHRFLLGLFLVLFGFYAYRLWSVYPTDGSFQSIPSQRMELVRTCMAAFLLIPFFQCRIATWSWRMPYSEIFFQLCRNVFLLFQSAIVTAVFWALLLTASLLFDIVGLGFVPQVLFSPLVAVPLTSLTIAISISVALKHPGIDSLGRWILSILAWLLPPFSLLSLVFVACLPYSGLKTLWSTGQASSLMLFLQLATILLANAAWLDGTRSPFSNRFVNGLAQASLLCLPVYTGLCLYSLGLRVQQYGLSVDRVQAAFLVAVTGIWGIGYAGAAVMRQWPSAIGRVNIASALIMTVIVVAMNSPLLDPFRLSANNQVDRLLQGRISPADFDYLYLRFNLGRYGNYALKRLDADRTNPKSEAVRKRIAAAMAVDPQEHWKDTAGGLVPVSQRREILTNAKVYPAGRTLSKTLVDHLVHLWEDDSFNFFGNLRRSSEIAFLFKNVTGDPDEENLLLVWSGMGLVMKVERDVPTVVGFFQGPVTPETLASQDIAVVPPRFRDLELQGVRCLIIPLQ